MIKNKTVIEHKIGERVFEFVCNSDSPLGEIHDTLCVFKTFVIERILEAQKKETEKNETAPIEA
jgi:hypothetical protein